jgi:hypothetical protein
MAFQALECPIFKTFIGGCHAHYFHLRRALWARWHQANVRKVCDSAFEFWHTPLPVSGGSVTELSATDACGSRCRWCTEAAPLSDDWRAANGARGVRQMGRYALTLPKPLRRKWRFWWGTRPIDLSIGPFRLFCCPFCGFCRLPLLLSFFGHLMCPPTCGAGIVNRAAHESSQSETLSTRRRAKARGVILLHAVSSPASKA